jgi:hypothetical protein
MHLDTSIFGERMLGDSFGWIDKAGEVAGWRKGDGADLAFRCYCIHCAQKDCKIGYSERASDLALAT